MDGFDKCFQLGKVYAYQQVLNDITKLQIKDLSKYSDYYELIEIIKRRETEASNLKGQAI